MVPPNLLVRYIWFICEWAEDYALSVGVSEKWSAESTEYLGIGIRRTSESLPKTFVHTGWQPSEDGKTYVALTLFRADHSV